MNEEQQQQTEIMRQLRFFTKTEKTSYIINEPIIIKLGLQNLGGGPIFINSRLWVWYEFDPAWVFPILLQITNCQNIEIAPRVMSRPRIRSMEPKEKEYMILNSYEEIVVEEKLTNFFRVSGTGKFTLLAQYCNRYNGEKYGLSAWTGELDAEPLEFWITE